MTTSVPKFNSKTAGNLIPVLIDGLKRRHGKLDYENLNPRTRAYLLATELQNHWNMNFIGIKRGHKGKARISVYVASQKSEKESEFIIDGFKGCQDLSFIVAGICDVLERKSPDDWCRDEIYHTKPALKHNLCNGFYNHSIEEVN